MTIRFRLPSPERRERSASSETLPDDQSLGRPWVSIGIFGASHEDKVNFIQTVAGQENLSTSATDLVRAYDFLAEGIDFSLVEFPSFGDAHSVSDEDTFFGISNWFEKASLKGQYFHGLIYLYGIIDDRENGSESRNLRIFKELCGAENLKNSIVGFTRWDQEEDDMVEARKKALKEIPEFWGDLSNDILRVEQITSDRQKCMDMLSSFAKTNPMTLNIQKQIIVVQNPPDITSAVSMIKDYQRRHAIRDAEELEHATQQNYHQEKLRKLRQQALARAAEHEEKFNRLLESQNVELHELTMQNEKGLTDPNRYADIQARRLEGFQHLRLTMATQERDLKPELFKLDEQNVRRLEELDNAKLRRRAAAHKESLIQRRELLKRYDESLGPQQAFEYLDQKFDKRLRMDYEMRFCYHCLDQLSLFDSFWSELQDFCILYLEW